MAAKPRHGEFAKGLGFQFWVVGWPVVTKMWPSPARKLRYCEFSKGMGWSGKKGDDVRRCRHYFGVYEKEKHTLKYSFRGVFNL